ncbi:hypothetical protein AVEN_149735-1 [Araneus ventricosus]|uniref:Uncharacterized protein n=1 Tax=Araneus ventricosus TaxID=182803 RepID=A0A4Y2MH56_ARAVE|nr:hypothetical protein AVEN_149735-1 [Araneus ventricosus]
METRLLWLKIIVQNRISDLKATYESLAERSNITTTTQQTVVVKKKQNLVSPKSSDGNPFSAENYCSKQKILTERDICEGFCRTKA